MIIARVIGTIVSTVKHPSYSGFKLLLVRPLHLPGDEPESAFVAIDTLQSGVGDTVLVCQEGNSTRQIIGQPNAPIRSSIVGILDSLQIAA